MDESSAGQNHTRTADDAELEVPSGKRRLLGDEELTVLRDLGASVRELSTNIKELGPVKDLASAVNRLTSEVVRLERKYSTAKWVLEADD